MAAFLPVKGETHSPHHAGDVRKLKDVGLVVKIIHRVGTTTVGLAVGFFALSVAAAVLVREVNAPMFVILMMAVVTVQAVRQTFIDLRQAWRA